MQIEENLNITEYEIVNFIKQICAIYFEMPENIYTLKTRKAEVIKVKHYAIYFSQRHTNIGYVNLAKIFSLKDHSSICSLIKKIDGLLDWDKVTKKEVSEIETIIRMKGLAKGFRVNLDQYYFINMDTLKSIRENSERAVLFVGYTDEEITDILNKFRNDIEIREHKNTKKYILEPLKNNTNE